MTRTQVAMLLTLGLAGCTTVSPQLTAAPPPPPPPPVELGSINGLAAFHTAGGAHRSCSGLSVLLIAQTPQTDTRMSALYGSQVHAVAPVTLVKARSAKLGPPPSTMQSYSAQCDLNGRFSFGDLQAGGYFLIARVRLQPPQAGVDDLVILQHVALHAGEAREVELAQ